MVKDWIENGGKEKANEKYDSIETQDFDKMRNYFTRDCPKKLQEELWFSIVYYLALCGREVLHDLPRNALEFSQDSNGVTFVFINKTFVTKNVKASLTPKEYENLSQARMYENSEKPESCPIQALKLYLTKIPKDCNFLFPIPCEKFKGQQLWYCSHRALGVNSIGSFMKIISLKANLNRIYTNHCVRVSVVSNLRDNMACSLLTSLQLQVIFNIFKYSKCRPLC